MSSTQDRHQRGATLMLVIVVIVAFVLLGALAVMMFADASFQRISGDHKLEASGFISDAGVNYYLEQWRRSNTFLDSGSGTYPATSVTQNANIGVARACGGGTFTLIAIDRAPLGAGGATDARVVTVRGDLDGTRWTYRALLSPNLNSPIQGVGTTGAQLWRSGARFGSTGDAGTIFGNSTLTVQSTALISGNASFSGAITNNGTITGTNVSGAPPVTFPDQVAVVNSAIALASGNKNTAGFWRDVKSDILTAAVAAGATKPTAIERVPATASNLNLGSETTWSGANTMNMDNMLVRGGNVSLPAGNYAFGRLYLDGATVTLKAPSGGGVLVMPDIYLTNGARLILDTTDGPFKIVTGKNNAYESSVGSSGAQRYNPGTNSFAAGAPSLTVAGGDTGVWNGESGGGDPVKKSEGNGHLDDWLVEDTSLLAVVTSSPSAVGAELFMKSDVDLVLANGSSLISGIQAADLGTVKTGTLAAVQALTHNATGFAAWSAGGGNPRLDINSGSGSGGAASLFVGLTYGAWPGSIGANGTLEGAFVGSTLTNAGSIIYDSRLAALVASADPNSHHVVVRTRVQ